MDVLQKLGFIKDSSPPIDTAVIEEIAKLGYDLDRGQRFTNHFVNDMESICLADGEKIVMVVAYDNEGERWVREAALNNKERLDLVLAGFLDLVSLRKI